MNETDLIHAITGIDDKYIFESERPHKKVGMIRGTYRTSILIVVILVFSVPICAYAISSFLHRDNVEHYIAGTEMIEVQNPGVIKNYVMENEDYRITVDTLFSDGHNAMLVTTHEALGENSRKYFNMDSYDSFALCITYADGSRGPFTNVCDLDFPRIEHRYIYDYLSVEKGREDIRSSFIIDCKGIDPKKDILIEFFMNEECNYPNAYFSQHNPELADKYEWEDTDINNYLEGIEFTTKISPNVNCNTLQSSDGRKIYLSSFEIYTEDISVITENCNVTFITDIGERIVLERADCRSHIGISDECAYIILGEFVDPNDYDGVEVNGIMYWK